MKFLLNLRARLNKNILKGNAGQGATEYILLLVVVVGLVVAFKKPIMDAVTKRTASVGSEIENFTGN